MRRKAPAPTKTQGADGEQLPFLPKAPLCPSSPAAYSLPAGMISNKEFSNLQAAFALRGHTLHREAGKEAPGGFYAARWGLVRYLPTPDDARRFLMQIGGTL